MYKLTLIKPGSSALQTDTLPSEPPRRPDSAIKNNEFESFLVKWVHPEPVIQSDVSQKEKTKYHILTHIYGI